MPSSARIRREQWEYLGAWLRPETLQGKVGLSLVAHLVVLFLLLNSWWFGARRLRMAGTRDGVKTMLAYVPGKPVPVDAAARATARPKRKAIKAVSLKTVAPEEPDASESVASAAALGNDEVSIARVQGFPHEHPDLSRLGQSGDVIVDVEIDDTGHVIQVHARKGVGGGVDEIVLATVEQWVFHPALRGGKPVESRREIRFHFDRGRNPSCGWDCFALAAD